MKTEFNLSEKIILNKEGSMTNVLNQDYVIATLKEFIRLFLKFFGEREIHTEISYDELVSKIQELAGDKLT